MSNEQFIAQEGQLRYFCSPDARVLIATPLAVHQACHIRFSKDGSIFVQFPHFLGGSEGILSCLALTGKEVGQTTVDLKPTGKVVSSLVKLSHHPDGKVHFSQDGKIKTAIGRAAWPLSSSIGKVFELNFFHLSGLALLGDPKTVRKLSLPFAIVDQIPIAVSIVGEWLRKADLVAAIHPRGGTTGPAPMIASKKTGEKAQRFLLGQPPGYALRDHVLMLTCRPIPLPEGAKKPTAIILGGWDPHEAAIGAQPVENKGLLVGMYPCGDFKALASTIGSLDFAG
jgi:hypothetical protein